MHQYSGSNPTLEQRVDLEEVRTRTDVDLRHLSKGATRIGPAHMTGAK